jgi:hypothetical protein
MFFSEKILYNKQVYHSLFYLRKGKTDSFSVYFKIGEKFYYGQIVTFFESKNNFFLLINRFNVEVKNLVTKNKYVYAGIFYDFVKKY